MTIGRSTATRVRPGTSVSLAVGCAIAQCGDQASATRSSVGSGRVRRRSTASATSWVSCGRCAIAASWRPNRSASLKTMRRSASCAGRPGRHDGRSAAGAINRRRASRCSLEAAARLHHAGFVHRGPEGQQRGSRRQQGRAHRLRTGRPDRPGPTACAEARWAMSCPMSSRATPRVSVDAYALGATVFEVLSEMSPRLASRSSVPRPHDRRPRPAGSGRGGRGWSPASPHPRRRQRATPGRPVHQRFARRSLEARPGESSRAPRHPAAGPRTDKWLRCAFEAGQHASEVRARATDRHGMADDRGARNSGLGESLYNGAAGTVLVLRALGTQLGTQRLRDAGP